MSDSTQSRVIIDRPPAQVMAVIADVAAYPEWNEEVRSVEVLSTSARDERPERVRFVIDASPIRDTYVLAYRWEGDRAVHWSLLESQVLAAMDGAYLLSSAGGQATEVTYRLSVDLHLPVIGVLRRKGEKVIVERALQGLKKRVEA